MHHPWRWLRDSLPDWDVVFERLPGDLLGDSDPLTRTIRLDSRLLQVERRSTLEHEMRHALAGDVGEQDPKREAQINEAAARSLVTLDRLVDACLWAHSLSELAEECWVDEDTMQCRLDTLNDAERAAVRAAIAQRDFHEEAWPDMS